MTRAFDANAFFVHYTSWTLREKHDAIGQRDRLRHVMRHHDDGWSQTLPELNQELT